VAISEKSKGKEDLRSKGGGGGSISLLQEKGKREEQSRHWGGISPLPRKEGASTCVETRQKGGGREISGEKTYPHKTNLKKKETKDTNAHAPKEKGEGKEDRLLVSVKDGREKKQEDLFRERGKGEGKSRALTKTRSL